jgi:hypothetical protein
VALDQLSKPGTRNRLTVYDVNYLRYCCKFMLAGTSGYVDSAAFSLASSIPITYDQLDIGRVKSFVRRTAWITPEWAASFDDWFRENLDHAQLA